MKPRIADLERLETKRSDPGWFATLDEHRGVWESLPALLRLARAAKASRAMLAEFSGDALPDPEDFALRSARADKALDDAIDAFDWDD